jgi:hypothetical protein
MVRAMRVLVALSITAAACGNAKPHTTVPAPPATAEPPVVVAPPAPAPAPAPTPPETAPEVLSADTPKTTVAGNTFIAPAGWSIAVKGQATILTPPEGGSHLALVDVPAKNSDQAVALAWAAYDGTKKYEVKVVSADPDRDGWSDAHGYDYIVSPNEKRAVGAGAMYANGIWTVLIFDFDQAIAEKRGSQIGVIASKLLPKGYSRESFAGKQAAELDAERIAELSKFVETAQKLLGVPGVSVGIIQNGKTVMLSGFGVRELGKPAKVDGDTKFIIASNTKALTTLMLAKLVDEKKLTWDTPATTLLPTFKLGDPDTTSKVMVKHLICACTGLPRRDLEWLLHFKGVTPDRAMAILATFEPRPRTPAWPRLCSRPTIL